VFFGNTFFTKKCKSVKIDFYLIIACLKNFKMSILQTKLIFGDLLESKEHVIVHQLNCIGTKPRGLSEALAKKFPYSNVYGKRKSIKNKNLAVSEDRGTPGDIEICYPPNETDPIIIGMYGQYAYGSHNTVKEDKKMREQWFAEALEKLRVWLIENNVTSVAFPYGIGCGLAGGDWHTYLYMLEMFAKDAPYVVKIYMIAKPVEDVC